MIGKLPIQGYGFSNEILAQAVGLIQVLTEHKTKKYMNDVCNTQPELSLWYIWMSNGDVFIVSALIIIIIIIILRICVLFGILQNCKLQIANCLHLFLPGPKLTTLRPCSFNFNEDA